ncbi:hypothetical protein N7519_007934 [Penicillium mononematosum]|uniref:uncharacterized protein n=1 Tax=Penicillium mononematosum TaxID=268346 RepID=UPI002546A8F9|nr:uncharacterized protein N7519_007934 [Penicillium mononematosum]KAJ6186633.1 hypothetical protein N7519_007934 [Penicillium mononematosum]
MTEVFLRVLIGVLIGAVIGAAVGMPPLALALRRAIPLPLLHNEMGNVTYSESLSIEASGKKHERIMGWSVTIVFFLLQGSERPQLQP